MSTPQWAPVTDDTADLLDLLADPSPIPDMTPDQEWRCYVMALRTVAAQHDGAIPANSLRPCVRGVVAPQRIGAFARRALLAGLVEYTGEWDESDDTESGNAGKPCREMRWIGGAS